MLQPKKQKYRKSYNASMSGVNHQHLSFGEFGVQTVEPSFITARQIEAARKAMTHFTKRSGKIWIRIFPQIPVTNKPAGTRMGGGKGAVVSFGSPIKVGTIIFEMGGLPRETAKEAFRLAGNKLPVKLQFIEK
jgi:large subunit ribosomal protein L16